MMVWDPVSLLVGLLLGAVLFGATIYLLLMRQCESTQRHIIASVQQRFEELTTQYTTAQQRIERLDRELRDANEALHQARETVIQLQTLLDKEEEVSEEKLALLQDAKEQMRLEFQTLSRQIADTQSRQFLLQNSDAITKIVTPFKEQLEQFQQQIHELYIREGKERSMLQQELHHLKTLNQTLSQEAHGLSRALKGESKQQGIWGEMILETVLEASGLRLGHEYEREVVTMSADDTKVYRPDVVVHLPDQRDIIIDAKTSLLAYERYVNGSDESKTEYIRQHSESLNLHVKQLSEKNYTKLKGIHTVDFVLMFVPIESALSIALEYDATLYERAYKKNILLVSPTTLMVALRAVENSWRYDRSQKNAQEIAKRAGMLYDKFVGFIQDMQKIEEQITMLERSYSKAYNKLHGGKGSLTSQLHKLKQMGASTSKSLPDDLLKSMEEV